MKQRRVPLHSKRFHRKLVRKMPSERYLFWLRCKRPHVWARLQRWYTYHFLEVITNIDIFGTPFAQSLPKVDAKGLMQEWALDHTPHPWYSKGEVTYGQADAVEPVVRRDEDRV